MKGWVRVSVLVRVWGECSSGGIVSVSVSVTVGVDMGVGESVGVGVSVSDSGSLRVIGSVKFKIIYKKLK